MRQQENKNFHILRKLKKFLKIIKINQKLFLLTKLKKSQRNT